MKRLHFKKFKNYLKKSQIVLASNRFEEIPILDKSRLEIIKNFYNNDQNKLKKIVAQLIITNKQNIQELEKRKNKQLKKYYEDC